MKFCTQFSKSFDRLGTDSKGIVDLGLEELAGLVRVGQAEGLSDAWAKTCCKTALVGESKSII